MPRIDSLKQDRNELLASRKFGPCIVGAHRKVRNARAILTQARNDQDLDYDQGQVVQKDLPGESLGKEQRVALPWILQQVVKVLLDTAAAWQGFLDHPNPKSQQDGIARIAKETLNGQAQE